jgi:hypothetical protein
VQERFLSRWSKRTWFEAVWAAAVLGVLIFVEVSIAESEDAFNFNELFEFTAFVAGLIIWGIGFGLIQLVAGLVAWRKHEARPTPPSEIDEEAARRDGHQALAGQGLRCRRAVEFRIKPLLRLGEMRR